MKLVRNTTQDGTCKYALVRLDKAKALTADDLPAFNLAVGLLEDMGVLEYGKKGDPDEFFAIKLKDVWSKPALVAYAQNCMDRELARDVMDLAYRSGIDHPNCKKPD